MGASTNAPAYDPLGYIAKLTARCGERVAGARIDRRG